MPAISTFFGLETTLRGLLAQQGALDVTSHNIANANTLGYSRQQAVLGASDPLQVTDGARLSTLASIGTGVDIQSYSRVRNQFLDLQYRAQNMVLGQQSTTSGAMSQVEAALQEPSTSGLSTQLSKFWSAWSDVANNPTSSGGRQSLIDQANGVTETLHGLDTQLTNAASQASAEYTSLTQAGGEIDQDAQAIANLNTAIQRAVSSGDKPNDLMDKRDQLLDKLSELGQVSVTDLGNGSIQVNFGDAAGPLVNGSTVTWPQTLNNAGPPPTTSGGKLQALNDLFKTGGTVDSLRADLNGIAGNLASSVNAIYNTGIPAPSGVDFFTVGAAGTEAATIAVNVTPASLVPSTPGNAGNLAQQIANLSGGTTDSLYSAYVTRIGSMTQDSQRKVSTASALTGSVDSSRQSTSGVSMDEEMTNMVKFQRAYQASARAMSTMDELLDILINRTGKVGL
jgi:flagellar hook-associated protein 1 FlgK